MHSIQPVRGENNLAGFFAFFIRKYVTVKKTYLD